MTNPGPVPVIEPLWEPLANGGGSLYFSIDGVPLTANTRSSEITEAEVRAFAAGLRANGTSAADGLDPDSGGDFATVDVIPGAATVSAPASTTAVWAAGDGTLDGHARRRRCRASAATLWRCRWPATSAT